MEKNKKDERFGEVEEKLFRIYGERQAGYLLGIWLWIERAGEGAVRKRMKESTFFRSLKLLYEAGITWNGKYRPIIKKQKGVVSCDGNS